MKRILSCMLVLLASTLLTAAGTAASYRLAPSPNGFALQLEPGKRVLATYVPPGRGSWVAYELFDGHEERELLFFNHVTKTAKTYAVRSFTFDGDEAHANTR
ncbi:hypothetical protein [Paenibacillus methanolicus]|uniref:hypothetical protein n=1 Tax=Paenibacillus methanolicus TaxID=582686 RepID=UPI0011E7006F|nr:hypothetical protein [Paenibacillus methanolicus]